MAVSNATLLCLCLVAVAASVAGHHEPGHEAQTLPGKGGRLTGGGHHGVQTLPAYVPPRRPQVQPRPGQGQFGGRPGDNLRPIDRPTGPLTRPFPRPPKGGLTKPLPRPSKGGDRFRRANAYSDESPESDEGRYRREVDGEPEDDEEYDVAYEYEEEE